MVTKITHELLSTLSDRFGEAFYILDSKQFEENYKELFNSFSLIYPKFNIAYSYKTNYIPKLCRIVNDLGGMAEVVSDMELALATKAKVKTENIIWNGPTKDLSTVENFLLSGGLINIDSTEELEAIKRIIERYPNNLFKIGIRCNFDIQDGVLSRFGFDIDGDDFESAIKYATMTKNVVFQSLHCHFAQRNLEFWPQRVKGMLKLIDRFKIAPKTIDIGGGIFGKMNKSLQEQLCPALPSYNDYANVVAKPFLEKFGIDGPELIIEPGTALVGDCMKFVGTVKSIKQIRGKRIATIFGSQKNINMIGVNPPIEIISTGSNQNNYENIDLVGYTCIEGDVLYKNYNGKIGVGDYIIISNCGSYSLVMKPPFILPNFPVIEFSNGMIEIIKKAETFDDVFHSFLF